MQDVLKYMPHSDMDTLYSNCQNLRCDCVFDQTFRKFSPNYARYILKYQSHIEYRACILECTCFIGRPAPKLNGYKVRKYGRYAHTPS